MSSGSTTDIHCCITHYKKGTDTGDQNEYKKMVLIQRIVRIQKNNTILKNSVSEDFKLFTTIKERIIVILSSMQER